MIAHQSRTRPQAVSLSAKPQTCTSHRTGFKAPIRNEVSKNTNVLASSGQCHRQLRRKQRLSAAQQQHGSTRAFPGAPTPEPATTPRSLPNPSERREPAEAPHSEEPRSHCPAGPSPPTAHSCRLSARPRSLTRRPTTTIHHAPTQPLPAALRRPRQGGALPTNHAA